MVEGVYLEMGFVLLLLGLALFFVPNRPMLKPAAFYLLHGGVLSLLFLISVHMSNDASQMSLSLIQAFSLLQMPFVYFFLKGMSTGATTPKKSYLWIAVGILLYLGLTHLLPLEQNVLFFAIYVLLGVIYIPRTHAFIFSDSNTDTDNSPSLKSRSAMLLWNVLLWAVTAASMWNVIYYEWSEANQGLVLISVQMMIGISAAIFAVYHGGNLPIARGEITVNDEITIPVNVSDAEGEPKGGNALMEEDVITHVVENEQETPNYDDPRAHKVVEVMENNQLYLNPKLNLQDLANISGIRKQELSRLFKEEMHTSFYGFLNKYRTDEAIKLMKDGEHIKHTFNYIAEQSGFNSRATFNRIFKQIVGISPSEFAQNLESEAALNG